MIRRYMKNGRPVRQTDVEVVIPFHLDRNRPDS
jgi:hypothetical protein